MDCYQAYNLHFCRTQQAQHMNAVKEGVKELNCIICGCFLALTHSFVIDVDTERTITSKARLKREHFPALKVLIGRTTSSLPCIAAVRSVMQFS
ncbi:CLUMA_CG021445, isoform A [Clunio marinus]|uniref:CLUMA_CG021445, isoform A n=1 Tax=Clunio marinus TaxID=568069 RepID=A0A1J1J7Z0_9DIPT|nr:CLUMA_CG021445, isoform A [Clunio marinus]